MKPLKPKAGRVNLVSLFRGLQRQMIECLSTDRESIPHAGTKGDASELHWLEMLNEYLPRRYRADKAFVVSSDDEISEQIDIVVYDRQYSPFLFNQDGAIYVPAESVYAAFEVKQELGSGTLAYASKKISSVRRLRRTSVVIPHAGGKYAPIKPRPILGGFLSLDTEWAEPFGKPFSQAIRAAKPGGRLDLGCALKCGGFEIKYGKKTRSEVSGAGTALIFFFLRFLARLQRCGTVPALDFAAYEREL